MYIRLSLIMVIRDRPFCTACREAFSSIQSTFKARTIESGVGEGF